MADTDLILEAGATVDLSDFVPKMEQMAQTTQTTATSVASSFESMSAPAVATGEELSASINRLIESNTALMDSVTAMSTTVTAAMERTAAGVRTSAVESEVNLKEMAASFGEVAEAAELSARGTVSALGPIGGLIGAGFVVHYTEQLKESVLQQSRLSDITGISVSRLAQFRLAMEEVGVPTENLSRVLLHMTEAMKQAADGSKTDALAFQQLGVNTDTWNKQLPDVLNTLFQISDHLHKYKGNADDAAATTQILGLRMGLELAGGMAIGSKAIQDRMAANKALGDETEAQVLDAKKLQEAEAELSARIQEALLPLLGVFANVLDALMVFWSGIKADWTELVAVITMGAADIIGAVVSMGHAIMDALTFNWKGLTSDWDNYKNFVINNYQSLKKMIEEDNKDIQASLKLFQPVPTDKTGGGLTDHSVGGGKSQGPTRVQEWKQELEMMKENADTFHAVTAADEVTYWQRILNTQKLSAKERFQIETELLRARHAAAVDAYHQLIALDEEFVAATRVGSAERMAAVMKERDDITHAWGAGSSEAIAANKKVLDEQMKDSRLAAEIVAQSVEKQSAAYMTGSAQRVAIAEAAIARLKEMQANLVAGKTSAGAPEVSAPVGPTPETDSRLRVLARENESTEIQKIIDNLTSRLASDSKTQMDEDIRDTLTTERERVTSIARTGRAYDENTKLAERSATEITTIARTQATELETTTRTTVESQLRDLEKLRTEHLIGIRTENEQARQVIETYQETATAEIQGKIRSIQAERESTIATIEQEALKRSAIIGTVAAQEEAAQATEKAQETANEKIQDLERQLVAVFQQADAERKRLTDEVANYEVNRAQTAASLISASFSQTFSKMQSGAREHLSFMQVYFNNLQQGFANMVNKMISDWVKMLAQTVILKIAHEAQISTLETASTAAHTAQTQARVAATAVGQTEETAAVGAGESSREGIGLADAIKNIMSDAAQAAAHVFKWVMQEVPFPANVALAPAAAAAAFTGVAAYATFASAAGGMEVDRDQLIQVHKDEKVLPAEISRGFTNIIKAGSFSAPASIARGINSPVAAQTASPGAGANHTHYHQNEFNLYHHGKDAREVLENEMVPRIREAMRNGELNVL